MSKSTKSPTQPTSHSQSFSMDTEMPIPGQLSNLEGHPLVLDSSSNPSAPPIPPPRRKTIVRQGAQSHIDGTFTSTVSGSSTSKRGRDPEDSTHERRAQGSPPNPIAKCKVRVVEHGDVDGFKQELSDKGVELESLKCALSQISAEKEALQKDHLAVSEQLEKMTHQQKLAEDQNQVREEELRKKIAEVREEKDTFWSRIEEEKSQWMEIQTRTFDEVKKGWDEAVQQANQLRDEAKTQGELTKRVLEERLDILENRLKEQQDEHKRTLDEQALDFEGKLATQAQEHQVLLRDMQETNLQSSLADRLELHSALARVEEGGSAIELERQRTQHLERDIDALRLERDNVLQRAVAAEAYQADFHQQTETIRLAQDEHKRALDAQALDFEGKLAAQAQEHQVLLRDMQETNLQNALADRLELRSALARVEGGESAIDLERQRTQHMEQDIDALRLDRDSALQRAVAAEALQVTLDEAQEKIVDLNTRFAEIENNALRNAAEVGREKEELLQKLTESQRLMEVERQKVQRWEQGITSMQSEAQNNQPEPTQMDVDPLTAGNAHSTVPQRPMLSNAQRHVANLLPGIQEPSQETIRPPLIFQRAYGADTPLSERLRLPQLAARARTPLSTIPGPIPASNRSLSSHLQPPRPITSPSPGPSSYLSPSDPLPEALPPATDDRGTTSSLDPAPPSHNSAPPEAAFISTMKDMVDAVHALNNGINARFEEMMSPKKKSRSSEHGAFTGRNASRPRSVARNQLMAAVRKEMNKMLGIEQDEQIVDAAGDTIVSPTEVAEFLASNTTSPTLNPLRPFWDKINSPWNHHLARSFADYMRTKLPDVSVDPTEIRNCFLQRLTILRKLLSRNVPQYEGEPLEDITKRVSDAKQRELHERRIRGRKTELYNSRLKVSESGSQGGVNEAWNMLFSMVDALGIDGNSSDETDTENRTTHQVRAKDWRSVEVRKLLEFIDENRKTTNAYGNALPGTRPRLRLRSRYPPPSRHAAVYELPRNFYSDIWYDSLTEVEQAHLGATDPIPLPEISHNRLDTPL